MRINDSGEDSGHSDAAVAGGGEQQAAPEIGDERPPGRRCGRTHRLERRARLDWRLVEPGSSGLVTLGWLLLRALAADERAAIRLRAGLDGRPDGRRAHAHGL